MKKRTSKNTETSLSLSETILNQLSNDLISLNNKPLTQSLNGFILKDINDIYSFTDEHISIKLIFDQTYFNVSKINSRFLSTALLKLIISSPKFYLQKQ